MSEIEIEQQVLELEDFRINEFNESTISEMEEEVKLIYDRCL